MTGVLQVATLAAVALLVALLAVVLLRVIVSLVRIMRGLGELAKLLPSVRDRVGAATEIVRDLRAGASVIGADHRGQVASALDADAEAAKRAG